MAQELAIKDVAQKAEKGSMTRPLNIQIQNEIVELRKLKYSYTEIQRMLHLSRGQVAGVLYRYREQAKDEAAERAIAQALRETNERAA